jgi:HK97 family phage major capsid protein
MIRAFAYLIDHDCLQGDGNGKALGIINTPNVMSVFRQTSGAVTLTDLVGMDERLNDLFDPTSDWFMRSSIGKSLRISTLGTQGYPLWMEGQGYQAAIAQPFK